MQDIKYVTVGKIASTHGNRGMLKVLPLTDFPERFKEMDKVLVYKGNFRVNLHIQRVHEHKKYMVIQFKEVKDVDEAKKYKGALLQVKRDEVMELPEDSYYIFEIVDCSVYDSDGYFLGTVKDVIQTGANDVYAVEKEDRDKPLLIPALKSIVKEIDIESKEIQVELPEWLD